jgi:hypothetical protein
MEHNPDIGLGVDTLLDSDNDNDNDNENDQDDAADDDGPYGQNPARVVRRYNTFDGLSVLRIVVNRFLSDTSTNADGLVDLITHSL